MGILLMFYSLIFLFSNYFSRYSENIKNIANLKLFLFLMIDEAVVFFTQV